MSKPREVPGAQTAQRALRILKLLGTHHAEGMTAAQIVLATSEERSAVQRALSSLIEEGLVERDPGQRRYRLGIEAMHLGRATLHLSPLVGRLGPHLKDLARITGDTVFLSVRVTDFALCVFRDEGSAHVRVPRTRVGDLRVLGTTAGGLALMAELGDAEIRGIFERHAAAFGQARLDFPSLRRNISLVRRNGFALLHDNVSEGVTSLGICLRSNGEPFAVAAVAAATSRMSSERVGVLHRMLESLEQSR